MIIEATGPNGFRVRLKVHSTLSVKEEVLLRQATRHMANAIGSEGFKSFCRNHAYTRTVCKGILWWKKCTVERVIGFESTNAPNGLVYDTIMKAAEVLDARNPNYVADLELVIDRRNKRSVLGYTYPDTTKQWMYSWLLSTTYQRVAGNLAHEWAHKLGFTHTYRNTPNRKHSVPYAVGDFVAGIVR